MENLAITASGGYTRFMIDGADDIGYIPVIGGVKAYPGIGRMYLSGNVGAGLPLEDGAKVNFVFGGGLGRLSRPPNHRKHLTIHRGTMRRRIRRRGWAFNPLAAREYRIIARPTR